jgi:hypothetical protein
VLDDAPPWRDLRGLPTGKPARRATPLGRRSLIDRAWRLGFLGWVLGSSQQGGPTAEGHALDLAVAIHPTEREVAHPVRFGEFRLHFRRPPIRAGEASAHGKARGAFHPKNSSARGDPLA